MWYSVELLNNREIFIQTTEQRLKHGAKGVVLLPHCLYSVALQIQLENKV
jgi:hypothetical protein